MNHLERLTKTYDVSLIANFPENYDASFFKGMKINFINATIERKISLKNDLKALAALYKIFKNNKFDSVHSVTPKQDFLQQWLLGWQVLRCVYISIQDRCGLLAKEQCA